MYIFYELKKYNTQKVSLNERILLQASEFHFIYLNNNMYESYLKIRKNLLNLIIFMRILLLKQNIGCISLTTILSLT